MMWWNITLLHSSGQKQESITCKFTKNWTPSRVFFKKFNHNFRTALLIKTSQWVLLTTIIFRNILEWLLLKGSCDNIFIWKVLMVHIFYISYRGVMLKRNKFSWISFKHFGEKYKHMELALHFTFSLHFIQIATWWSSK